MLTKLQIGMERLKSGSRVVLRALRGEEAKEPEVVLQGALCESEAEAAALFHEAVLSLPDAERPPEEAILAGLGLPRGGAAPPAKAEEPPPAEGPRSTPPAAPRGFDPVESWGENKIAVILGLNRSHRRLSDDVSSALRHMLDGGTLEEAAKSQDVRPAALGNEIYRQGADLCIYVATIQNRAVKQRRLRAR